MRAPRSIALAACALAAVTLVTACSSGGHSNHSAATTAAAAAPSSSRDADIAFAQMMIPHHQQAVQLADMALSAGAGPEVTRLAQQIKGAQDPEIQQMRGWLTAWGAPQEMDHGGGHMHMPGMVMDDQLNELRAARGDSFDRLWKELMIAHHEGAIDMANGVLATTSDPDVTKLAKAIVAGQTAEIAEMTALLQK